MDQDESPQRFPLRRLIVVSRQCARYSGTHCEVVKARGYGETIRELELTLDDADSVTLDLELLEKLAEGEDEWFYDLEAILPDGGVRFGLHDSTALFVESEISELAQKIAGHFTHTRQARSGSAQ